MGHKFLEPITIGKQQVKNRIVYLAMAKCYSGMDGTVSPRDLAYIASIAKGGVGIVIPGAMVVEIRLGRPYCRCSRLSAKTNIFLD